jgi:hypothetical protein
MTAHECQAGRELIDLKWRLIDMRNKANRQRDNLILGTTPGYVRTDANDKIAAEYHLVAGAYVDALLEVCDAIRAIDPELAQL